MNNLAPLALVLSGLGLFQVGLGQKLTNIPDSKVTEGPNGISTVETSKYSFEIPTGWTVGKETPWGARDITPNSGPGRLGAMTAGPTKVGWDQLYKTSLFFIKQEEAGTETPFRTGKTKMGYEFMAFQVKDKSGFLSRRYTLIRNSAGNVLALSIKIPSPELEAKFAAMFKHMIDTAKLKG